MRIEHIAINVPDVLNMARWYVEHLGLTVKRRGMESPFAHFLADEDDASDAAEDEAEDTESDADEEEGDEDDGDADDEDEDDDDGNDEEGDEDEDDS